MKQSKNSNDFPKLTRFLLYLSVVLVFAFLSCFATTISSENEPGDERYTLTKEYEEILTLYYTGSLVKSSEKGIRL